MPKDMHHFDWDKEFMAAAMIAAMRSKDPSTKVGACIVSKDNIILGLGYNGFPRGCSDDEFPWERSAENPIDTKYPFVVHAERNAIHNLNTSAKEANKIYVTLFPCNECAKDIAQRGIKEVIYLEDKYHDSMEATAARIIFDKSKPEPIKYRQYKGDLEYIMKEGRRVGILWEKP